MNTNRRQFLKTSAAYAVGFAGLRSHVNPVLASSVSADGIGYGDLVTDPAGMLDLPEGFSYKVIGEVGQMMDDGLLLSSAPDGMAAFDGPDGLTLIVRNHENTPLKQGPYGKDGNINQDLYSKIDSSKLYDDGHGELPCIGGTTTVVFDTKTQKVVRQFQSLGGTERNCAGGPTPWGSWITCEETVDKPGTIYEGDRESKFTKAHGYNFEVPATADINLVDAVPLVDMGRFRHEAVAVDPVSGAIYETEDINDGAFYRFLPNKPGKNGEAADLQAGGKLQGLMVVDHPSMDTRNWHGNQTINVGDKFAVRWIDLEDVESPDDTLRYQAYDKGCARFTRGEGIWYTTQHSDSDKGEFYFACTSGGAKSMGQIWRYVPSPFEGEAGEAEQPGTLELFLEPNDSNLIQNADNLTVSNWGDLIVCEDRQGPVVRLVGVTPDGQCYTFANNHVYGEFAGVCFSPNGTTLFVNLQTVGKTLAITGPWLG